MNDLMALLPLLIPLVLGGLAVWLLLPRDGIRAGALGGVCGLVALVALGRHCAPPVDITVQSVLFYLFGGGAIVAGVLMITDRNPVYAALWFALVTLCTCGLFLLNSAPFLAAATVIVYAGAIVVTFLFVIMLAQQAAAMGYDRRACQPELAVIVGCLLAGSLLYTLQEWTAEQPLFVVSPMAANPLSEPQTLSEGEVLGASDLGTLQGVGRSLFGDYLFAVELAGTVLLIATIGAIALAPRRSQGTL